MIKFEKKEIICIYATMVNKVKEIDESLSDLDRIKKDGKNVEELIGYYENEKRTTEQIVNKIKNNIETLL